MRFPASRAGCWVAALAAATALVTTSGMTAPLSGSHPSAVADHHSAVLVAEDWDDDDDRPYRRHHHGSHVVDAPFTHVETGVRGRVAVDAPFASVRVDRRGTWVRAPFVNLFVPR